MEKCSSIEISIIWQNIVVDFYDVFNEAFKSNKKAHFDCLQPPYNLVDGARSKWCIPQLLDVLIFFYEYDIFKPALRRDFSQQKLLADCILKELQYQCAGLDATLVQSAASIEITMDEVVYPWNSVDSVRTIVVKSPPSKSKKKYVEVVNQLCTHLSSIMHDRDLAHVIKTVISKLLCKTDSRSVCIKQSPSLYQQLPEGRLVACIACDKLIDLERIDYFYSFDITKTSAEGLNSAEGVSDMGCKRKSPILASNADDEFIIDTFALETRYYRPATIHHTAHCIEVCKESEYECASIPDQDIVMDEEEEEEKDDGQMSEFNAYVDSIESSEHSISRQGSFGPINQSCGSGFRPRFAEEDDDTSSYCSSSSRGQSVASHHSECVQYSPMINQTALMFAQGLNMAQLHSASYDHTNNTNKNYVHNYQMNPAVSHVHAVESPHHTPYPAPYTGVNHYAGGLNSSFGQVNYIPPLSRQEFLPNDNTTDNNNS